MLDGLAFLRFGLDVGGEQARPRGEQPAQEHTHQWKDRVTECTTILLGGDRIAGVRVWGLGVLAVQRRHVIVGSHGAGA